MTTDLLHKPGYDGPRPSSSLSGPERQKLRLERSDLVLRLHDAMLCLSVAKGLDDMGVRSNAPSFLREFSDLVGVEKEDAPTPRFKPTAAQISAMDSALALLEGLTKNHFKVVFYRALDDFSGEWPWAKIGAAFGMSDRWAESTYDAAIVQAARRAGILEMCTKDHAILVCSVWLNVVNPMDRGWRTSVSTSSNPRQDASNLKSKSPIQVEGATIVWVSGQPLAKRIVQEARSRFGAAPTHGSWYKASPDGIVDQLTIRAREIGAPWFIEDLDMKGRAA